MARLQQTLLRSRPNNDSPSGETRNLRPNTLLRGTNETEFMLIFDYPGL